MLRSCCADLTPENPADVRPYLFKGWLLLSMVLPEVGRQDPVIVWPAVGEGEILQLHHQRVQPQHARQGGKHLQTYGSGRVGCKTKTDSPTISKPS